MKNLLKKFYGFSRFKQIVVSVLAFHAVFTVSLLLHHLISSISKKPKALVVRTVKISPPPKQKKVVTLPKKIVKKKPKSKKAIVKAKKPKKATPTKKNDELLKELAQSFDVFKSEEKKMKHIELNLPSKIESKEIVIENHVDQVSYGEFLITYLQNSLDLPEYGDVLAKLTIDQLGRLASFEIIHAKSKKNADFLKKEIHELAFPKLDEFGLKSSMQTFTITFRNIEIH